MRIGSINQVSQLYQNSTTLRKKEVSGMSQLDAVSISSAGKDYQVAKNALANTPDVRQDKIDSLKQRISDGTYNVSAEDFAEKLIATYKEKKL